jgi:hypothetical protein
MAHHHQYCPRPVYDQRQGNLTPIDIDVDLPEEQEVAAVLFGPSPVIIDNTTTVVINYDMIELKLLDETAF